MAQSLLARQWEEVLDHVRRLFRGVCPPALLARLRDTEGDAPRDLGVGERVADHVRPLGKNVPEARRVVPPHRNG